MALCGLMGPALALASALDIIEGRLRGRPEAAAPALAALAGTQTPAAPDWPETQAARGAMLVRLADAAAVEAVARELAASAGPATPRGALVQATAELLRAQWLARHGSLGQADRQLGDAMAGLAPDAPPGLRLRFLAAHAGIKESRGQLDAAVGLYQRAVLLADQVGPAWRQSEHRNALAYALTQAHQLPAAGPVTEEAMALARQAGDVLAISRVMTTRSLLQGAAGDTLGELRSLESAIALAHEAGATLEEVLGLANLADHYLKLGDYATAKRLSLQALPLARAAHDPVAESVALTNAGLALIGLGRRDDGLALVRESLMLEERAGGLTAMAQIQREAGLYLERAGFLPEAWEAFNEHRRLADEVFRREHQQALLETQAAFEHERRQRELAMLATEQRLGEAQLERRTLVQRLWAVGAIAGVMLLAVLALLLLRLRRSNAALHDSNARLLQASERDPLTGLANRRHLQRVLRETPLGAGAAADAVLLIDIDHFKHINDSHGHATGDVVLVEIAERLRAALRNEDLAVRWGGEEFIVVVRALPPEPLDRLVDDLLQAIAASPVLQGPHRLPVTVSIGFASFPVPPEAAPMDWERAVDLVDNAMYLAKAHGRNCAWGVRWLSHEASHTTLEAAWRAGQARLSQHPGPSTLAGATSGAVPAGPATHLAPGLMAGLASALALALALLPQPAQARPAPAGGELAALQAQAAAQVEIGFDRPDAALAKLGDWQAGTPHGSPSWQVLQTARGLVAAVAGRQAEAGALAEPLLAAELGPLAVADGLLVRATSLDVAGDSQRSLAQAEAALAGYQRACPAATAPPRCDHRLIWRSRYLLARLHLARGQSSLTVDQAQAAAQLAGAKGDTVRQALAVALAARANDTLGQRDEADRLFAQSLRLARLDGSPGLLARMALAESFHRDMRGDTFGSQRAAERGLPAARGAGSPRLEAMLLANLSDSYLQAGQPRRALQAVERALPVVRSHGDRRAERVLLVNAGLARIALGQLDAARQTLEELHAAFRDTGASADQAQLLREFGAALAAAGDLRGALDQYHRERAVADQLMQANRETALAELRQRFGREAQERQLEQLTRENRLIATQLANRSTAQALWAAAALALVLAAVLAALLYRRVHHVNRRLAHNHDMLRRQSLHDPLTGLANRRALAEALPGEATGGLLLVDIDHFKRINDECGHAAGDAVLLEVAQRLLACAGAGDLVVRWGGEEFLIHAPGLDAAATADLAGRVCQAVAAQAVALPAGPWPVTVSVGHGSFPLAEAPGPMPRDRAIHLVDIALYGAKNQGRNRSVGVAQTLAADATATPFGLAIGDGIHSAR